MATAKGTPPVKGNSKPSTSRALQPWEAKMAEAAKKQAAVEKPMGLFKQILVKAGNMYVDDKAVPGNQMEVVVLAATHENQWYDKPYDPNVPAVPACYAFGDQKLEDPEAAMTPAANVDDRQGFPEDQDQGGEGASCSNCWANLMGSANTGKGKACQNVRRLILTTPDALESPEKMKDAEARSLKIPVMSVRYWVAFVHEIEETMKRPYYGVVARLFVVPDAKAQWLVKLEFSELINFTGPLYEALEKRVTAAQKDLMTPYPKLEEAPPPARGGRQSKVAMPVNGRGGKAPPKPASKAAPARKAGKY